MDWPNVHALIHRAKSGDDQAWHALDALARPYLLRLAGFQPGARSPDLSGSDLVQDALLKAWKSLHDFEGGDDDQTTGPKFQAWLRMILIRTKANWHRDGQTQRRGPPRPVLRLNDAPANDSAANPLEPAADQTTPSGVATRDELDSRVAAALESLDETDRAIVRLRFFDGVSLRQVADKLQLSYDIVLARFHKALDRLGMKLKDDSPTD